MSSSRGGNARYSQGLSLLQGSPPHSWESDAFLPEGWPPGLYRPKRSGGGLGALAVATTESFEGGTSSALVRLGPPEVFEAVRGRVVGAAS